MSPLWNKAQLFPLKTPLPQPSYRSLGRKAERTGPQPAPLHGSSKEILGSQGAGAVPQLTPTAWWPRTDAPCRSTCRRTKDFQRTVGFALSKGHGKVPKAIRLTRHSLLADGFDLGAWPGINRSQPWSPSTTHSRAHLRVLRRPPGFSPSSQKVPGCGGCRELIPSLGGISITASTSCAAASIGPLATAAARVDSGKVRAMGGRGQPCGSPQPFKAPSSCLRAPLARSSEAAIDLP